MAIPDHIRANFETLLRAARNGDLALMECTDASNGIPRMCSPPCSVTMAANTFSRPSAIWRRGIPTRLTTRQ